jgi:hypothetical protein
MSRRSSGSFFISVFERKAMARVIVNLGEHERSALDRLAKRERRIPRAQAALIIRQELERRGILSTRSGLFQETHEQVRGGQ